MDDKNYLGLGIVFRAIDDGYSKSLDKATKKAEKAQKIFDNVGGLSMPQGQKTFPMSEGKEPKHPFAFPTPDIFKVEDAHKALIKSFHATGVAKDKLIANFKLYQKTLNNTSEVQNQVSSSSGGIRDVMSKFFGVIQKGYGKFSALGKAGMVLAGTLDKVISGTGKVSELAKQLDTAETKMAIVFDAKQAARFNSELRNSVKIYGLNADQIGEVTKGLTQWGTPINDAIKMVPVMSKLIAGMHMDAGLAAKMFGTMTQRMQMSIAGAEQLTAEIFAMGQEHGIMDMLDDLPGIVDSVNDSMNKLGQYNTKAAIGTIKQTAALSAMYLKMGINQKQAVEGAKKVQSGVTSMITDIRRMQVGLDPKDFDGMIDVAAELSRVSGMGFEDTMNLMKKGPQAVQEEMIKLSKTLSEDDRLRLGDIMGDKFGEEFGMALKSDQAQDAIAAVGKKVTSTGEKAAKKMNDAVSQQMNTFDKQEKILKLNLEMIEAMGQLLGKAEILKGWQNQVKGIQAVQEETQGLMKWLSILESSGLSAFAEWIGITGGVIKAIREIGSMIGTIPPIFSRLRTAIFGFGRVFIVQFGDVLSKITSFGKTLGSKIVPMFKIFGKVGTKALGPIGTAIGFIMDGMDALKEKSFGKGIATLLFGKDPEKTVAGVGTAVASQATKWGALGATIGTFIAPGLGTAIGGGIGAALGAAGALIKTYWGDISEFFSSAGEKVSSVWNSMMDSLKNAWGGLKDWISKNWSSLWAGAGNVFSGMWDGLKNGFVAAIDWIKGIFAKAVKWIGDFMGSVPGLSTIMEKAGTLFKSDEKASSSVQTIQAQEEAPKLARVAKYEPKFKEKDSGNTLDDVVKALVDVRNMIQDSMGQPTPVQIVLEADAKKLLKLVKVESGDRISLAGMANAMGG